MNEIPTIILKAKRVSSTMHRGDLIVFAYAPTATSCQALQAMNMVGNSKVFRLDLEDETGSWIAGAKWEIVELEVETNINTALRMVLTKPQG
jgi:hypothetical protein